MPGSSVGRQLAAEVTMSKAKGAALKAAIGEKFSPKSMAEFPPKGSETVCPTCNRKM